MYEKPEDYKHWDFTLIDMAVLELCYFLAFYIRHKDPVPLTFSSYTAILVMILFFQLLSGMAFNNYAGVLKRGYLQELMAVIKNSAVITAGIILFLFVVKDRGVFSRLVVGYFFLFSIPLDYLVRVLYKKFLRKRNTTGYNRRKALLITSVNVTPARIESFLKDTDGVADVCGIVVKDLSSGEQDTYCRLPIVCAYDQLIETIRKQWVDEIFILRPRMDEEDRRTLDELSIMGITLHTVLNTDSIVGPAQSIETMGDSILLTQSIHTISLGQAVAKRLLDIVGALVGLVFTGIFTVIFGPAIYIADPGPIFYKQKRVGKNGRVFNMYKFRSMYQDADKRKQELMKQNEMSGLMFKMKNDPRILGSGKDGTKHGIGWLIRTTSIDEFPQFLNVLLGQLSLVGTRPPTLDEWKNYESHHRARMAVKPGITGLWQVSGRNKITDFEDVVKLDLQYIQNFSMGEDLKILARTVAVVLKHEGAE